MTKQKTISILEKINKAVIFNNTEQLSILITQCKKSIVTMTEALNLASVNGHAECVKLLIPVSDLKSNDSCALRLASRNGHTECVKLLIPVSNAKDIDSFALRLASENGRTDCVELLLPHSDISSWDKEVWHYINYDIQHIILSYYSKTSLINNVSPSNNKVKKSKKSRKI